MILVEVVFVLWAGNLVLKAYVVVVMLKKLVQMKPLQLG